MIKKGFFLFSFILFSISLIAQTGSGTFNFQTSNGTIPIVATATSLLNNAITYPISGNTNTAIHFSTYNLTGSLSIDNQLLSDNLQVFGNPANEFNAILKVTDFNSVVVKVFDLAGKQVSNPLIKPIQNGAVQIVAPLNQLSNGLYIVTIQFDDNYGSLKFLKNNSVLNKNAQTAIESKQTVTAKNTVNENYHISWDKFQGTYNAQTIWTLAGSKDVEILSGNTNNLTIDNVVTYDVNQTGDLVVLPYVNGTLQENVKIVIESMTENFKDSLTTGFDGFVQFQNIPVINPNPTQYKITLTHLDGIALETIAFENVLQGEDFALTQINMNAIPNEQDITFTIRNYKTHTTEQGVTIDLINNTTNTVIDTQVSDANGTVLFDNVPGDATYKTRTSKVGDYTKTVGTFEVPHVDTISEMSESYNTTTIPKETYSNGDAVTAEQANKYRLLATNTELVHGRWKKYIDAYPNLANIKTIMNDFVSQIGFPNAITYYTTPFAQPTASQIATYNAYGPQPFSEDIGTNVTGNTGGNSGMIPRVTTTGLFITYNTDGYQLGSSDSGIYHEIAQVAGFEQIASGTLIPVTCLDPTGPSVLSMYDKTNMTMKYQIAKDHFIETANAKPLEYNFKVFNLAE